MSSTGIPSVIAITVPTPASIASSIAAAAKRAGTKIIEVFAPRSSTRLRIVSKTGTPSTSWPPLPGVTPATRSVPYSRLRRPWKVPSRPVRPETTSFVSVSTMIAHAQPLAGQLHDRLRRAEHRLLDVQVPELGLGEHPQALLGVGAVEADDQRHRRSRSARDASMIPLAISSQRVMPPKMLNRIAVTFGSEVITSSASTIASAFEPPPASRKLAGLAARLGDDVERRHAEAGAVSEDADVAAELDVGEALLLGHRLLGVLGRPVGKLGELGMAKERVVVDRRLRVERDHPAIAGHDQRVDLDQRRVLGERHLGELGEHLGDLVGDVLVDPGVDRDLARLLGAELLDRARRGA